MVYRGSPHMDEVKFDDNKGGNQKPLIEEG